MVVSHFSIAASDGASCCEGISGQRLNRVIRPEKKRKCCRGLKEKREREKSRWLVITPHAGDRLQQTGRNEKNQLHL